jgi:hypothetical protein
MSWVDPRGPGPAARRGARPRRRPRKQIGDAEPDAADRDDAQWRPGRDIGIIGQLAQRGAGRDVRSGPRDMVGEHRRPDREDRVVAVEQTDDAFADRRQEPGEQRVILGEAAAPRHRRRPYPRIVALSQLHHGLPGLVAIDRGAHDECGPRARVDRGADPIDRARLGPHRPADHPMRDRFGGPVPVVDRDRDEGRPARRRHRNGVGASDRERHVGGAGGFDAPFDIGPRQFGCVDRVQERIEWQDRTRLLARHDDHRGPVRMGGENIAHRIPDARRRMQADERGVAGRLRIAVRHPRHGRLLEAEHIAKIGRKIAEQRELGRTRIAEYDAGAEPADEIDDAIAHAEELRLARIAGHAKLLSRDAALHPERPRRTASCPPTAGLNAPGGITAGVT